MEPVIQSLTLQGFRSVAEARITFSNPTFLVGRNGSGKSNLVDGLTFLAEAVSSPLAAVIARRGGMAALSHRDAHGSAPAFAVGVDCGRLGEAISGARYEVAVRALGEGDFAVSAETLEIRSTTDKGLAFKRDVDPPEQLWDGFDPVPEPFYEDDALALPAIGGDRRIAPLLRALAAIRSYAIDPAALRQLQDPDSGRSLSPDGHNAASILREIERAAPGDLARVSELLSATLPYSLRIRPVPLGSKLALEFGQGIEGGETLAFDASLMSDGTLRTLGLILAVFQRPHPSVLVLEEPESTLHPGALGVILDLIRMASQTMQVVVTTHSPELLEAKWIEDRHLRVVTWENGATRVRPIAQGARRALQEGLMGAGELLRADALEPQEGEDVPLEPLASAR